MRAQLKAALRALNLYAPASRAWIAVEPRLMRIGRALTGRDQALISRYLADHPEPALHIGCGDNELPGWLNTELCPRGAQIFLDATRRFPFSDGTFHFIYCEHMIEHIGLRDAEAMLVECARVMAPGGVIRLVTPDVEFLTTLLRPPADPRLHDYIAYSVDTYRIYAPNVDGVSVFNNFVRAWGHQYIHSVESLRALLLRAGFEQVEPRPLNDSPHPSLRALAKSDRMPPGFLEMESFVLEGTKPAPRR